MKEKKNKAEAYFAQKNYSTFEIVCIAVLTILGILGYFFFGWYFVFMPIVIVGIILAVSRSVRPKDSDIDTVLQSLIEKSQIEIDEKNSIACYDLTATPIRKGADSKLRTHIYVISHFDFAEKNTYITSYTYDLVAEAFAVQDFTVPSGAKLQLEEEMLAGHIKHAQLLVMPNGSKIAVATDDINASDIIERLCGTQEQA